MEQPDSVLGGSIKWYNCCGEKFWQILIKINVYVPYDPASAVLRNKRGSPHKDLQTNSQRGIIPNSQDWMWTKCPSNGQWRKKKNKTMYLHRVEYYAGIKRNELVMAENIRLSETSLTLKKCSLMSIWNSRTGKCNL